MTPFSLVGFTWFLAALLLGMAFLRWVAARTAGNAFGRALGATVG